jgi:hypothetical protein
MHSSSQILCHHSVTRCSKYCGDCASASRMFNRQRRVARSWICIWRNDKRSSKFRGYNTTSHFWWNYVYWTTRLQFPNHSTTILRSGPCNGSLSFHIQWPLIQ